jgi:hypothetical protein
MKIIIPENISFADLKLARNSSTVTFDMEIVQAVCDASNIDIAIFTQSHEDNIAEFIVRWYFAHLKQGGDRDPIADDLMTESDFEYSHGGGFSLPGGNA